MNRIYRKFNWPSKALALVALLGYTITPGHAQTVLIDDSFSGVPIPFQGPPGLGGSTPDTTDVPGTTWVSGHYGRGIGATWSSSGVLSDYSGNGTLGAGISLGGDLENIDTLSVDIYKSTSSQAGSQEAFGFSTQSSLDNGVVDSGTNFGAPGYNQYGFVIGTGGLGVLVSGDGSGSLYLNGTDVSDWGSPLDFVASTGNGSSAGENAFTLSYNDVTDTATVTEAGDLVASTNVGALSLQSAGLGGYYLSGYVDGNGGAPDGFDNFEVSTQAVTAAPEPSTWALMLSGAVGLFFIRRLRNARS